MNSQSAMALDCSFGVGTRIHAEHIGDSTMAIAQQTQIEATPDEVGYYDITPSLGYSAFVILLLIGIYWAARSCGTTPGDLALMAVLP
jgi:hypothetical protein